LKNAVSRIKEACWHKSRKNNMKEQKQEKQHVGEKVGKQLGPIRDDFRG
jgi:hypothetical protein